MAISPAISVDDLMALNDEIAALSRAGVPLHRGLISLGDELPGRAGSVATALGKRLEAGESLDLALEAVGRGSLPPAYLAVVRAGLRAGRLPAALEGIVTASRRAVHLRRTIGLALIYPTMVLVIAYTLFVLALVYWLPVISDFYREMNVELPGAIRLLLQVGQSARYWALIPPLALIVGLLGWWLLGRIPAVGPIGRFRRERRTGLVGLLRAGRLAGFAEVLALLVEQQVPLADGLILAGDASGDRTLAGGCRELAEQLNRGQTRVSPQEPASGQASASQQLLPRGVPPLLGWMILNGRNPDDLATSLRHLAASYRTRARELGDWLAIYLPMWLTAGIGGTAVAFYVIVIFAPWSRILLILSTHS